MGARPCRSAGVVPSSGAGETRPKPFRNGEKVGPASLIPPSGFAQTVEHVGVIFRSHPRRAVADVRLKSGRRDRDGLLQRLLRLLYPSKPTECGGKRPIG